MGILKNIVGLIGKVCVYTNSHNILHPVKLVNQARVMSGLSPLDPTSFSRPELAIITHMSLSLDVDFVNEVLRGESTINFCVLDSLDVLVLDVNNLHIESIHSKDWLKLKYKLGKPVPKFGSKLTVMLPKHAVRGDVVTITIKYTTDPLAPALTWLKAQQTTGKRYPYLFSQSSPINARSILPCQDTPTVKFTYYAAVTAPEELTVLMSALRRDVYNNKSTFCQSVPIPSSLFAIAVGDLESRTIGPRSKVWSEKEDVDHFAIEFLDVEKYLQAAEKLLGPYDWTEYNILVLPPAFPHAGMENPCLTFASPTIVVGDKSLIGTIIHEIVHSWIGNAVSVKNFEHFWFKEGLTVFLERKISASFIDDIDEAKQSRDFHHLLGLQELIEGINTLGADNPFTKLVLNLDGVHPSDSFSIIPYEKGSLFFMYLEILFGGPEIFDPFINFFVKKFRMLSMDTYEFKDFCRCYFQDHENFNDVDWDSWLHNCGMPPIIPNYDTTMTDAVTALVTVMEKPDYVFSYDDVKTLNVHQIIHLLQQLIEKPPMPKEKLRKLTTAYKLDESENKEILYRWLRLCVRSKDECRLCQVSCFLNSMGRLKFVRPLYRELYAWEDIRQQAINNFLENEKYMSHLTAYNLRKDLHLCNDECNCYKF